jgi:hypothetical protein
MNSKQNGAIVPVTNHKAVNLKAVDLKLQLVSPGRVTAPLAQRVGFSHARAADRDRQVDQPPERERFYTD